MAATHLDVGLRCIKYLLCAVNSLFVLTGIMMIFVGTRTIAIFDDFYYFLVPVYFSPATLLIVVGVLIFIIAFFGCCGALKESTCMVLVFAVSLSIVLLLEVAAAISAYALEDGVIEYIVEKMDDTMSDYNYLPGSKAAVDFLQTRLRCCGVEGPNYWNRFSSFRSQPFPYPESCCDWTDAVIDENGTESCLGPPHEVGCFNMLSMLVHRSALNLGTAAMAIALIQLTGIMFACTLGRAIRRQKTIRERRRWELRESLVRGYQPLGKNDPQTLYPVVYMQPDLPIKTPPDDS